MEIEVEGTPNQLEFWDAGERFKAFVGGVGSGKTWSGVAEAWSQPAGSTGMVLAPTYPMLRDATLRTFLELSREAGVLAPNGFHKSEKAATLINGTTVLFRTADNPERLRGPNLGWFWLDEAALMEHMVWLIMIGRLREDPGVAWVTSTPKGKNWLYREFAESKSGEHRVVKASSRSNRFLPAEFVGSLVSSYTEHFARQEIEGEWLDEDHELVVPAEWLDFAYAAKRAKERAGPRRCSVDISKGTGRDRTVILVADDLGLLDLVVSNTVSLVEAANLTLKASTHYGIDHENIVYDAGGWAGPDFGRYLEALGIMGATPYHGGAAGGRRWKNRRARAAWALRQRLDPTREQLLAPPPPGPVPDHTYPAIVGRKGVPEIQKARRQPAFSIPASVVGGHWSDFRQELLELRYTHGGAKIELEKKEDLVERLGRSPDLADAMLMLASLWGVEV